MQTLFRGLVHVSGKNGSGKTTFALENGEIPINMAVVDGDIKGSDDSDQLGGFGYYIDLVHETDGMKELNRHTRCLKVLDEIEEVIKSKRNNEPFGVLIWDNWASFENTFFPWVSTHANDFRAFWSPKGEIKGAEQWKASFDYESQVLNRMLKLARMVIITSHLKNDVVAGKKTGKMIPDIKPPIIQNCLMRVYLMPSPNGAEPIGLFLKRVSKRAVTENGVETTNVFPLRMEPCTWRNIRQFWNNPVGNGKLEASQIPNEFERSIIEGTLTDEQKWIMSLQVNETPDEAAELEVSGPVYPFETVEKVKELKSQGKTLPVIAKDCNILVSDVTKILSSLEK